MQKIKIKPLSVNDAWKGKRYKTDDYESYEEELFYMLPKYMEVGRTLHLEFGFSNRASDIDNPIKPLLDILQKKYDFNDKDIYELRVLKRIVPKGQEYIKVVFTDPI